MGIRSTINAGLTHEFMPDVIWGSVTQGLLQGVTSIGLQWVYDETGVNPLLGAITANTIAAGFEAILNKQNIFMNIGKQAGEGIFSLLTLGGYGDDPWSQAVYMSQVLDFSRIVQEQGLLQALETYTTSIFHNQTINSIVKNGGILDMITNRAEVFTDANGIQRKRLYDSYDRKYYIDINMANNAVMEKKENINGIDVITKQEYGVDANGKLTLKGRSVEEIHDDGIKRISKYDEANNLKEVAVYDRNGNLSYRVLPINGASSIGMKDGCIDTFILIDESKDITLTFENGKMGFSSADVFGSDTTPEPTYVYDPLKSNLENSENLIDSMFADYNYRLSGEDIFGASSWEVALRAFMLTSSKFQLKYGSEMSQLQTLLTDSERNSFVEYAMFGLDSILHPRDYYDIATADELAMWMALKSPSSQYGFSLTVVHGMSLPGTGGGVDPNWADNLNGVKVNGQNFQLTVNTWNQKGAADGINTGLLEFLNDPAKRRAMIDSVKESIRDGWTRAQEQGIAFDVASHSFGTVLTYEAIKELKVERPDIQIRNLYMMGSPLSYFIESQKVTYDVNAFSQVRNVVNICNPNDEFNRLRMITVESLSSNPLIRLVIQSDKLLGSNPPMKELNPLFSNIIDVRTDVPHGAMWTDPNILKIVEEKGIFTN